VNAKVIPVTIGAIGTISKSLWQYLSNIPGNQEIKELPTTAILGTAHTYYNITEIANVNYKTYFTSAIALHGAQIVNTEQLQNHIPCN
jgi:hypothetical protein